jgi:hypothetical protein
MPGKASNWAVLGIWVPHSTWHCNAIMAARKEALKDIRQRPTQDIVYLKKPEVHKHTNRPSKLVHKLILILFQI